MARLAALNVLPSPDVDDVKSTVPPRPISMKETLVRMALKASSTGSFTPGRTTMPALSLASSPASGTSAMTGRAVSCSSSLRFASL